MPAHSPERKRNDEAIVIVGAGVALVIAALLYLPLVIGVVLGLVGGLGFNWFLEGRRSVSFWTIRRRLALAGFALALAYLLLLSPEGVARAVRRFNRQWNHDKLLHLDPSALSDNYWAWLPPTIAIALVVAALCIREQR